MFVEIDELMDGIMMDLEFFIDSDLCDRLFLILLKLLISRTSDSHDTDLSDKCVTWMYAFIGGISSMHLVTIAFIVRSL